jgi:preprotein translocase subunit SecY
MNFFKGFLVVVCLTCGSAVLMWIGEQITEKGIGNGISVVLCVNIISRVPSDLGLLYENFIKGKTIAKGLLAGIIIAAIIILVIVMVLILNGAERRIPVQYSRKMVGRKLMGGQSTNIPLKVNTAGVIPVIFASSIMSFPSIIAQLLGKANGTGIGSEILRGLSSNNWCNPRQLQYSWGLILYIVLCVFFAYFYTSITFNPLEVADNIKKQGGFIPGIRPGKPTSDYLTNILNYIVFIGAVGLIIVCIIPFFFNGIFGANVSFGGTSIIIIVGVILETVKQVESQMIVRNYKGFLEK